MDLEAFVEEESRFLVEKYFFDRSHVKRFADRDKLVDDLHMFIKAYTRVSFVDINDRYGQGDREYSDPQMNIILWDRLRLDVAESIDVLLAQEKVRLEYCPQKYGQDGGLKGLPVADDFGRRHEQLSWLPAALMPVD